MPGYFAGVDVDLMVRDNPSQAETSGNALLSLVEVLMKPGADKNGTLATVPSMMPTPSVTEKVPLDFPPMTGSFCCFQVRVVACSAPSKVTTDTSPRAKTAELAMIVCIMANLRQPQKDQVDGLVSHLSQN